MINNSNMVPLSELVRMRKGTVQTYLLNVGDESYFQKKLSTYCKRAKAEVAHNIWMCVRIRDHFVQKMVQCTVVKQGKKLKRQRGGK